MSLFGVNEFAARFPNAIVGIVTLLVLFTIGSKERDTRFGWMWVFMYVGSLLPHFYFKSGIIDPVFNLFIFLGVYYLYKTIKDTTNATRTIALSGLFSPRGLWAFYWYS